MNRTNVMKTSKIAALSVIASSTVFGESVSASLKTQQPNILMIMADDVGFEHFGCYGTGENQTPVMDELARTGVKFTQCHSNPICTPSRVEIMTGVYNHRNYTGFGELDPKEKTFGNVLQAAGYKTCIAGKWQLQGDSEQVEKFGFDEHCLWHLDGKVVKDGSRFYPAKGYTDGGRYWDTYYIQNGKPMEAEYGPDANADFIIDFIKRNKDQPFLAYYSMVLPHFPWLPTPDSKDHSVEAIKGALEVHNRHGDPQYYRDNIEYADKLVGRIVKTLDDLGIRENTIIIFTGDNGSTGKIIAKMKDGREYKGGKGALQMPAIHTPLIANWKGTGAENKTCDDLVDFTDFLATFADIANTTSATGRKIDGVSFLPQIKGEKGTPREWAYCYHNSKMGTKPDEALFTKDWIVYKTGEIFNKKLFYKEYQTQGHTLRKGGKGSF